MIYAQPRLRTRCHIGYVPKVLDVTSVTFYGGGRHIDRVRKAADVTLATFCAALAGSWIGLQVSRTHLSHNARTQHSDIKAINPYLCSCGRLGAGYRVIITRYPAPRTLRG